MPQTGDPREGASDEAGEAWPVDVHSLEMDEPGAIAFGNGGHPDDISLAGHPAEAIPQLHSEEVRETQKAPASEPPQRSEERRVGKEWRYRQWRKECTEKMTQTGQSG